MKRIFNSDIISLHVYNNTPSKITLPLGLLGHCETNATFSPVKEIAYIVNNILQLFDICQSTILNDELSINNIKSNEKRKTEIHHQNYLHEKLQSKYQKY